LDDRRCIHAQAPHRIDEEVHGIREQRQSDHDLEGARTQDQPHARCSENADCEREDEFHQSSLTAGGWLLRGVRLDWWPSATRISAVAPTTRMNTPRSNSKAVAAGTFPTTGRSR